MAIVDKDGRFRGKIGELVFRVLDGQYIAQRAADEVRQTVRTKQSATMFGICSKQTGLLMRYLGPWFKGKVDAKQAARLRGVCVKIWKENSKRTTEPIDLNTADMRELKGFEFNLNAPFADYFLPKVEVVGEPQDGISIKIPSYSPKMDIKFPERTFTVDIHLTVFHFDVEHAKQQVFYSEIWTVTSNQENMSELSIAVEPILKPGLILVFMQLMYFNESSKFGKVYLNDKNCFPAQILYAR